VSDVVLGASLSHPGARFNCWAMEYLAQARVSRSSESPSLKREIEGGLGIKFISSPRREILVSRRKVVSPKRARLAQARVRGLFLRGACLGEVT